MDPSTTELASFNSLSDVMDWSGAVDSAADTNAGKPAIPLRSTLLRALGFPELVREIVLIKRESWDDIVTNITVDGDKLNPTLAARVESFRRVARLRCGLPAAEGSPTPAASTPVTGASPPSNPQLTGVQQSTVRKLRMSAVVDQSLDGEVVPISS